jgi:hypothetical protein
MNRNELIKKAKGFKYAIGCSQSMGWYDINDAKGFVVDLFNDDDFNDDEIEELLECDNVTIGHCCNTYYLLNPKVK